jgi:hypothetical protein
MTGMRRDGAERATSRLLVAGGRCEWKVILRKARAEGEIAKLTINKANSRLCLLVTIMRMLHTTDADTKATV